MLPAALKAGRRCASSIWSCRNGNIFLPLSHLTEAQRRILDPVRAPDRGRGDSAPSWPKPWAPPRSPRRVKPVILRSRRSPPPSPTTTVYKVLHETIQYLVERSKDEQRWLTALAEASFPVTVIWGVYDAVSPPRVASYVWNQYLMFRPGGNRLYFVPDANHYLQNDRPDAFVKVLLRTRSNPRRSGPWCARARTGRSAVGRQLS